MSQIIGIVRLSAGRAAFYDPLTKIHLIPTRPEAYVYAGMNTQNLKKGVLANTINLVSGNLNAVETKQASFVAIPQVPVQQVQAPAPAPIEPPKEEIKADVIIDQQSIQSVEVAEETKSKRTKKSDTNKEDK